MNSRSFDVVALTDPVALTQALVSINTYELVGKREALQLVKKLLDEKAPEARATLCDFETDAPYLTARIGAESPVGTLFFEGHLDVVPAGKMPRAFEGRIEGDWLIGRGAGDMKSGCAALITAFLGAAEAVRSSGAKGALWLMLSTDEEYAGEEIKTALSQGTVPKADFAVIAEPSDLSIMHRQKGECWITCRFAGRSSHSSTPELGVNALMKAARFMTKLEPRIAALKTRTSPLGSPTMSLGTLQGGTEPNVVPDAAEAVIDVRYLPGETPDDYLSLLEEIANECRAGDPDFSVRFEVTGDWPSMETPTTHPAVVGLKDAAERILGRSVGFRNMTGWGEAGFMERFGVPAVYFGPGDPKFSHTPEERCLTVRIREAEAVFLSLAESWLADGKV